MTSQSLALFSLFFLIICHHVRAKIVFQVERPLINIDFDKADKLYGSGDKYFCMWLWLLFVCSCLIIITHFAFLGESHFNNHYDGRYVASAVFCSDALLLIMLLVAIPIMRSRMRNERTIFAP